MQKDLINDARTTVIGSSNPEKQPGNQGTFTSKTQENHGLPTDCYFWPTLPFSNEF